MVEVRNLVDILSRHGAWMVLLNVFLEQIGLPIPAVPTLVVAGALAARGDLSVPMILLAALVASLVGDWIWYELGRRHGRRTLRTLCRISLSPDSCVRQTEGIFARFGMKSIVLSKFIAGFSTIAPPLAGAVGVGRGRFLVFAGLSALLWAGSAVGVGYLLHDSVESLLESLEGYGTSALVLLAAALVLFVAYKWLQRWRFQQGLRMARIEVDELRKRIQEGRATVIVDVRTEAGLRADPRRIPGAITMNLSDLDAKIGRVPPESELVLYCT